MTYYTEHAWPHDTEGFRQVMFPAGMLHLATRQEFTNRLGFTVCGRMIPGFSLVNDEIPERFRPQVCLRCETYLRRVEPERRLERLEEEDDD
jgi:hypothetical protein